MLYFPQGRVYISQEFPVAPGAVVGAEGMALVAHTALGVFGVQPSNGDLNEKFVGVAVSMQMTLTSLSRVEDLVVPSSNVVTLERAPSSGTLSVWDVTAQAVVPSGGGGAWSLTGATLTLTASQTGHEIICSYKYAVTAAESQLLQGDVYPGGAAGLVVGQVGVLKNGSFFTSEFDTTVNWQVTNPVVKSGPLGQFTIGGNGDIIPGFVVNVPSATYPYLGMNLTN
jgi:hypothetical protein